MRWSHISGRTRRQTRDFRGGEETNVQIKLEKKTIRYTGNMQKQRKVKKRAENEDGSTKESRVTRTQSSTQQRRRRRRQHRTNITQSTCCSVRDRVSSFVQLGLSHYVTASSSNATIIIFQEEVGKRRKKMAPSVFFLSVSVNQWLVHHL